MDEVVVRSVVKYLNAHRDGCKARYVKDALELSDTCLFEVFEFLYDRGLAKFSNSVTMQSPEWDDTIVFLTASGYAQPAFQDLF